MCLLLALFASHWLNCFPIERHDLLLLSIHIDVPLPVVINLAVRGVIGDKLLFPPHIRVVLEFLRIGSNVELRL